MNSSRAIAQSVLLTIAYVGTDFHGFALQPNARTVAGELLGAIRELDPGVRVLRGVSRTDAGVHARGQLVAFDVSRAIPPRGWVLGLARHLPDTIAVRRSVLLPPGFDPRGHVKGKWYRYTLLRDCRRDPFLDATSWRIGGPLDLSLARKESRALIGHHDFAAFRSAADERRSTHRTIEDIRIDRDAKDVRIVHVDVHGDGFLHNMVRIIVGTLVDVARGRLAPGVMHRGLRSLDRRELGITAPAQGLCLQRVELGGNLQTEPMWPEPGARHAEGAKRS